MSNSVTEIWDIDDKTEDRWLKRKNNAGKEKSCRGSKEGNFITETWEEYPTNR